AAPLGGETFHGPAGGQGHGRQRRSQPVEGQGGLAGTAGQVGEEEAGEWRRRQSDQQHAPRRPAPPEEREGGQDSEGPQGPQPAAPPWRGAAVNPTMARQTRRAARAAGPASAEIQRKAGPMATTAAATSPVRRL